MDLVVPKKELLKLVTRMQAVADKKSTMPVLQNILVQADKEGLRLSATDMYLGLSGKITAEVKSPGTVGVGAKDFFERVKMMPEGPIQITTGENESTVLKAVGSSRRYVLRGVRGEDFPPLPGPQDGAPRFALNVSVLIDLICKTQFSISTDETRAHLNSALFEWEGATLRMVTTDGHRLSKMEVKLEGKQASLSMLIPLKGLIELRKLCEELVSELKDKAPEVQLIEGGSSAFFQFPNMMFSIKLVEAKFPPYSQVIPQKTTKLVRAPRAALSDALRAVSIASSERTGGVKVSVSKNTLKITSESPDSGEGFDEVAVDYDGADISVGFNAKYFLDVLGALTDEEVTLHFNGELDPAVVRPSSNNETKDYLAVVMPMRI